MKYIERLQSGLGSFESNQKIRELADAANEFEARISALAKVVNPQPEMDHLAALEQAQMTLADAIEFFSARTGEVK